MGLCVLMLKLCMPAMPQRANPIRAPPRRALGRCAVRTNHKRRTDGRTELTHAAPDRAPRYAVGLPTHTYRERTCRGSLCRTIGVSASLAVLPKGPRGATLPINKGALQGLHCYTEQEKRSPEDARAPGTGTAEGSEGPEEGSCASPSPEGSFRSTVGIPDVGPPRERPSTDAAAPLRFPTRRHPGHPRP